MYCKEFLFFDIKLKDPLKIVRNCRVPALGLDLFLLVVEKNLKSFSWSSLFKIVF